MATKAASWKAHLDGWCDSGLSQAAYCRQHGLSLSSFGYWRRTLAPKSEGAAASTSLPALVPIIVGDGPLTDGRIEVRLPNGLQVVLPSGLDPTRLVPAIRAPCRAAGPDTRASPAGRSGLIGSTSLE